MFQSLNQDMTEFDVIVSEPARLFVKREGFLMLMYMLGVSKEELRRSKSTKALIIAII